MSRLGLHSARKDWQIGEKRETIVMIYGNSVVGRLAAYGAVLALYGFHSVHAGSFQAVLVSATGTKQTYSGTGGPPPLPITIRDFTNTGGAVQMGMGGDNAGSALYGTVTYNVVWVPAPGKTIQQDPPPSTYTLTANVQTAAHTASALYHPQSYVYTFDGFPADLQNNPSYPGNPIDPWYSTNNREGWDTYWNWIDDSIAMFTPVYATHTFTNHYPSTPISFNFAAANPADADNNTATWDTNPSRQPGAAWPCYGIGNYGLAAHVQYSIQLSVQ